MGNDDVACEIAMSAARETMEKYCRQPMGVMERRHLPYSTKKDQTYYCYHLFYGVFQHTIETFFEPHAKGSKFWESDVSLKESSISDTELEKADRDITGGHEAKRKRIQCKGTAQIYIIGEEDRIEKNKLKKLLKNAHAGIGNEKEVIKKKFYQHGFLDAWDVRILDINIDNCEVIDGITKTEFIKYTEREKANAVTVILTYRITATYLLVRP